MSDNTQVMIIDARGAGIAGDMIVGALLNICPDTNKVLEAMKSVKDHLEGCNRLEVELRSVTRGGIAASKLEIDIEEDLTARSASEIKAGIKQCAIALGLSNEAQQFASRTIDTLVDAEAKVHGTRAEGLHLHELGSADTAVDIIGTATALEQCSLLWGTTIVAMPVAVGGGSVRCAHGTLSSPAPATLEILRSKEFPIIGGPCDSELATPTGVALLVNMAHKHSVFYPPIKPHIIGYGAGTKDFLGMANVLRIVVGEPLEHGLCSDEVCLLETTIDDVTGEIMGYLLEKLLCEGVRDVNIVPVICKKNRPGQLLRVIVDEDKAGFISRVIMEETGSLGIRVQPCHRYVLARDTVDITVTIEGNTECVKAKVSRDSHERIIRIKPEYEDARLLAEKFDKPLKTVLDIIQREAGRRG